MSYKKFRQFDTEDVKEYLNDRYDERDKDVLIEEFGAPNEEPWEDFEAGTLTLEELVERRDAYVEKVIKAMCDNDRFEQMLSTALSNARYASAYDMFCATVRDFEDEL